MPTHSENVSEMSHSYVPANGPPAFKSTKPTKNRHIQNYLENVKGSPSKPIEHNDEQCDLFTIAPSEDHKASDIGPNRRYQSTINGFHSEHNTIPNSMSMNSLNVNVNVQMKRINDLKNPFLQKLMKNHPTNREMSNERSPKLCSEPGTSAVSPQRINKIKSDLG